MLLFRNQSNIDFFAFADDVFMLKKRYAFKLGHAMKFLSILLLAGVLSAPSISHAQEVAGRIVIAVGDVTIMRGEQKIAAQIGTEVRAGDTLQLGPQSNAQIMFTDESIVALREQTLFRLTEYAYQNLEPNAGRAFFNLIIGGMRTVTGLIGRRNHENYGVNTPYAGIGIRGTHYTLVHCDNSCRNPNGSLAPNGTYGGVADGRIGVTNQTGERQFGADQYFYVASANSPPQLLITPPDFLRDKLVERESSPCQGVAVAGGQQGQPQIPASAKLIRSSKLVEVYRDELPDRVDYMVRSKGEIYFHIYLTLCVNCSDGLVQQTIALKPGNVVHVGSVRRRDRSREWYWRARYDWETMYHWG